jgi:hypothetical protein
MLMEKGYATFKVKDAVTKKEITINNSFLTTFQEKTIFSSLISEYAIT